MSLTGSQEAAVRAEARDVCVSAGAGSGKTRVLTERFLDLVLRRGVALERILALTFTEKAAGEMKSRIAAGFRDRGQPRLRHEAERGFAFRNQQPLLRGLRLIARGRTPKPDHLAEFGTITTADGARTGTRPAYFGDGFVDTPVYAGAQLGAGSEVEGPALIEEPFTVVVVPPGARARLDGSGNYELALR